MCWDAEQQQAALEKPIDLFKAIFENEEDSSEEEPDSDTKASHTSTQHHQPDAAPNSLHSDQPQTSSPADAQNHEPHANGQLTTSQQAQQQSQQLPPIIEFRSQLQQQQQQQQLQSAPEQAQQEPVQQSAAAQLVSRIEQADELRSHRSSKKKRKHREDDEDQPRKKKHRKEKDRKRSGINVCRHSHRHQDSADLMTKDAQI